MGQTKKQFEGMQEEEANPTKTNTKPKYVTTEDVDHLIRVLKESIVEAIQKFTQDTLSKIVENMCNEATSLLNETLQSTTKPTTNARTKKTTQE